MNQLTDFSLAFHLHSVFLISDETNESRIVSCYVADVKRV